jgi:phosphate acetyltransferase
MEKKIFVASTEKRSGKSLVTIGLIHALQGIVPNVGYMKPIGQRGPDGVDQDARLVREVFGLTEELSVISPVTMEQATTDRDTLFERIFQAYRTLSKEKDLVVVEGTDYTSAISALEFDINAELAHNLLAPVLLVANGAGKSISAICADVAEVTESFRQANCKFLGVLVNRVATEDFDRDADAISRELQSRGIALFGVLPANRLIAAPRLHEVARSLDARVVYQGDDMHKVVRDVKILAMNPENALGYIKDNADCLIVMPGDRVDNILAVVLAQRSPNYPRYAGIVLTGGLVPNRNVDELFRGMSDTGLTVLSVRDDTYNAAVRISGVTGEIRADDKEKLDLVALVLRRNVEIQRIYHELGEIVTDTVTPRMFLYRILEKARSVRTRITLPEGTEKRIVQAAVEAVDKGICDITLLGDPEQIRSIARGLDLDLRRIDIIDPRHGDRTIQERYADKLYELRKHKSVTKEMALDLMLDPVHYATMMVYMGDANGFVSGSTHSTADTLGPVLRIIKTREGVSLASSIFFMCMPDRVLVYGDCALVENPTAEQMADIAITSADTARAFGIEPVVALLSYSTGTSGKGKDVDKVREAARIARERRPDLPIEGPMQYDAAVSAEVARIKMKDSAVAGKATVYIFPDLDAGNTAYKAVQRSANIPAIGPVMQGLRKPANDLSRGATVTDIVYTIAITAIQSQQK